MVQYQHALTETGQIVAATAIAGQPVTGRFLCIGCEQEMTAKVNGKIHAPHFAHKPNLECRGETYLHKLGKLVFHETYLNCREQGTPFFIKILHEKVCTKYSSIGNGTVGSCHLGHIEKQYDLTEYYPEIKMETRSGEFIPDLLLTNPRYPGRDIYIEIAVTHFLSEKKERLANRVIEIPLEQESDVEKIRAASLGSQDALFIGFSTPASGVTDSECRCSEKRFYMFYVFESGRCFLDKGELRTLYSNYQSFPGRVIYANPVSADYSHESIALLRYTDVFIEQVELAEQRGIKLRDCSLCRFHKMNWNVHEPNPVYCRLKKIRCATEAAVQCEKYWRSE